MAGELVRKVSALRRRQRERFLGHGKIRDPHSNRIPFSGSGATQCHRANENLIVIHDHGRARLRCAAGLVGCGSAIHQHIINIHVGKAVIPGQIYGPAAAGGQVDQEE